MTLDELTIEQRESFVEWIKESIPTRYFFTREIFLVDDEEENSENEHFELNETPRYYFANSWCCDDGRITSPYYDIDSIDLLIERMITKDDKHNLWFSLFEGKIKTLIKEYLTIILTKGDDKEELIEIDYYIQNVIIQEHDLELFPD